MLRKTLHRLLMAQRAVGLAAVVASTCAYVVWLRPARAHLLELRGQIASTIPQARGHDISAAPELAALQKRLNDSPKLIDPREAELVVRDLVQACEQAGMRRVAVRSGEVRLSGTVAELPVVLKFQGNFLDVCTFLRQVEALPWLLRTRNLQIRTVDPKTGDVEVRFSIKAISWEA